MLSYEEKAGLDEITDGINYKDWIVYTTEKSGKRVLDTKENFLNCMKDHYMKDKVVTPSEVRDAEKIINDYTRS